jgi:hypothetical protein
MAQFARTQPQGLARINRSNPLTRGLQIAILPGIPVNVANGKPLSFDSPLPIVATPRGNAFSWASASGDAVNTGYANPSASSHSGIIFMRTASVGSSAQTILDSRVSANNGFSFYTLNGGGTFPNQTVTLQYTHGGISDYQLSIPVPAGVNTDFVAIGFSAVIGTRLRSFGLGQFLQQISIGGINQSSDAIRLGRGVFFNQNPASYNSNLILYWNRELSDAEHAAIAANPWQLFDAPSQTQFPRAAAASGTSAALSGAASAVASATGSLTTSIRLSASAAVVASASGALSTQIALSGAAAGQTTVSGSLTTQIGLSGSGGAVSAASGTLSTQIALAGAAAGAASAGGSLSTQITLAGAAAASSSATGMLTAGTGLSGSASASSSASGALTTSIALAGSASCTSIASGSLSTTPAGVALSGAVAATSSASGSLSTAIVLAGAAVAQASASGSLAGQAAALSGSASAASSASGSLSTQIVVAGAAQAVASAVGSLTTAIRLAGAAACSSSATGSLSTGLLPPEPNPHRMIVVPRRKRHFVARHRVRHFEVGR